MYYIYNIFHINNVYIYIIYKLVAEDAKQRKLTLSVNKVERTLSNQSEKMTLSICCWMDGVPHQEKRSLVLTHRSRLHRWSYSEDSTTLPPQPEPKEAIGSTHGPCWSHIKALETDDSHSLESSFDVTHGSIGPLVSCERSSASWHLRQTAERNPDPKLLWEVWHPCF